MVKALGTMSMNKYILYYIIIHSLTLYIMVNLVIFS